MSFREHVRGRAAEHGKTVVLAEGFIFPDLDSGNVAYKLVQRLAGAGGDSPVRRFERELTLEEA